MKMKINNEQIEFLKNNVVGLTDKELACKFNEKFKTNFNDKQIKHYKCKFKLKSGNTGRFKKGMTPHNKKPVGSEFVSKKNGYTFIKASEPNIWVHKQQYIYELKFGKLPKGYSVIFLDGNKTNFDIDNLMAVRNKDKLVAKNLKLFSTDKEVTKTGIMTAQVINKLHELKEQQDL